MDVTTEMFANRTELPEGWTCALVGEVFRCFGGSTPSKNNAAFWGGEIPWLSSGEIKSDRITTASESITRAAFAAGRNELCRRGAVVVVVRSGILRHSLPVGVLEIEATINQDMKCFDSGDGKLNAWLALALRANATEILKLNREGTTVQSVKTVTLTGYSLPIPPVAEQKRIVAKVGELLERVNVARERLAKVPAILKRFRQAVLADACSGQLTAEWRETHAVAPAAKALAEARAGVDTKAIRHLVRRRTDGLPEPEVPEIPETWVAQTVRQLVEAGAICDFQDGNHGELYPRATDFGETGVKFLTATQVFNSRVVLAEAPLLKHEKARTLRIGFTQPGDVLLTHNATVGRVAVLPPYEGDVILGTSVTYYRVNPRLLIPTFLCFGMQGQFWQDQLRSVMEQTTRNQVSVTKQIEFTLIVPPVEEQHEIVRRVDALFGLADKIEARIRSATARVEKITQAILAKAFRGELVPTEAELARQEGRDYEPASILLERIRADRETGSGESQPPRRRPREKTTEIPETLFDTPPADKPDQTGAERPIPIDQTDRNEVMAIIRDIFSAGGPRPRDQAIHDIAQALGYGRVGSRISQILDNDIRTAVRRGILENSPQGLKLLCRDITEYDRDFLIEQLLAGMGPTWWNREDLITTTARFLGFKRSGPTIHNTLKSTINTALRRGLLQSEGTRVRRSH